MVHFFVEVHFGVTIAVLDFSFFQYVLFRRFGCGGFVWCG